MPPAPWYLGLWVLAVWLCFFPNVLAYAGSLVSGCYFQVMFKQNYEPEADAITFCDPGGRSWQLGTPWEAKRAAEGLLRAPE